MFKPHVTVACIVHAEDKFLVVEETINGKALWNQPAGHLEADETLVQAADANYGKKRALKHSHSILFVCINGLHRTERPFCVFFSLSSLPICALLNPMTAILIAVVGSAQKRFSLRQTCVRRWLQRVFAVTRAASATRCP